MFISKLHELPLTKAMQSSFERQKVKPFERFDLPIALGLFKVQSKTNDSSVGSGVTMSVSFTFPSVTLGAVVIDLKYQLVKTSVEINICIIRPFIIVRLWLEEK